MNIEQILREPQLRVNQREYTERVTDYFIQKKQNCVDAGDEQGANRWAILNSLLGIQNDYIKVFELLADQDYYRGWCLLERIEIAVKLVLCHYQPNGDEYKILFIQQYVRQTQKLFPYQLFGSSEFVKKEVRCSICNSLITLRKRCEHKKGKLYMGEFCGHVITQADFIGMSMVTEPFNKYSVMGVTGKEDDSYRYPQIDFLLSIIDHPFNEWRTKDYKILDNHANYHAGRNEDCPCGSKMKYKKCCLLKAGVELDHTEFFLRYPTLKSQGKQPTDSLQLLPA